MLKKLTRDARLEHRGKDKGSSRGGQGQTMWDCACQSSRSEEQWKCVNGRGGACSDLHHESHPVSLAVEWELG